MNTSDFFDRQHLRFEAYRLLADSYYLPEPSLMDVLVKLRMCMVQICKDAGKYVKKIQADIASRDTREYLKVDYARLFVGPFNLLAPPYGSVYLENERLVMGNSTADVQKRYEESGLDVATNFKDAPDHIAAELEFMHFLIFKEMEAIDQGDDNSIITCLLNQRCFLKDHLGAWVPEFTGNVAGNAKTSFYQNLARATEAFIKDDYQMISSVLTSWQSN